MVSFDTSYVRKDILESLEYVSEQLFEKYPGLDFTIQRRTEVANAFWVLIHDRDVFQTPEFQEFILLSLMRDYLWPKKVYSIVFVFEEKK
jgi:hypothetical protein